MSISTDPSGHSDLPRLARPEARRFGDFRKLCSVRVEGGLIRGDWPKTSDEDGYWNPFREYYSSETQPPYMALVHCGADDQSVKQFVERYGPIGRNRSTNSHEGIFDLEDFRIERWRFRFVSTLLRLFRSDRLRPFLLEAVDHSWKNWSKGAAWHHVTLAIASAVEAPLVDREGGAERKFDDAWCQEVRDKIGNTDLQRLMRHAQVYLAREFMNQLKSVRLRLDFPDTESPRLIGECEDLLTAFYWMLATDSDGDRAPQVCSNCKEFFFSTRADATYCAKKECSERGRRLLDWERNKEKYNRNRRLKRRLAKRQRTDKTHRGHKRN